MGRTNFEDEKAYDEQKEQDLFQSFKDNFVNPEEHQVAAIRSGYLSNLFHAGQLASGFGVLTDARFYYRGRSYHQDKWMLYKTNEESIVELQDITATGFVFRRNLIIAAAAGGVTLIVLLLIILGLFDPPENVVEYWLVTLIGLGIAIALWALYILYRRAIYQISHAGGMVAVKVSAYGTKELHEFDRKLHQAKDEKVKVYTFHNGN